MLDGSREGEEGIHFQDKNVFVDRLHIKDEQEGGINNDV